MPTMLKIGHLESSQAWSKLKSQAIRFLVLMRRLLSKHETEVFAVSIGARRLDDNKLPRLNRRPTRYYLVGGRMDGRTLRQWLVGVHETEANAIKAATRLTKTIVTDCRDWTSEELDNGSRSVLVEADETQDQH